MYTIDIPCWAYSMPIQRLKFLQWSWLYGCHNLQTVYLQVYLPCRIHEDILSHVFTIFVSYVNSEFLTLYFRVKLHFSLLEPKLKHLYIEIVIAAGPFTSIYLYYNFWPNGLFPRFKVPFHDHDERDLCSTRDMEHLEKTDNGVICQTGVECQTGIETPSGVWASCFLTLRCYFIYSILHSSILLLIILAQYFKVDRWNWSESSQNYRRTNKYFYFKF